MYCMCTSVVKERQEFDIIPVVWSFLTLLTEIFKNERNAKTNRMTYHCNVIYKEKKYRNSESMIEISLTMPVKWHEMQKLKLAVVFLKKWHERRWCGRIICCYFRPQCSHSTLFLFLSLSLPFVIRLFLPARLFSLQPVCCSTHCMLILDSACTHGCWQKKVGLIVCVHSRVCACVGGGGGHAWKWVKKRRDNWFLQSWASTACQTHFMF